MRLGISHEALARPVSVLRNEAKIRESKASGRIGIRLAIMAAMTGKRLPGMKVKFTKRALAKLDALWRRHHPRRKSIANKIKI